jgi:hypothetical protein
MTHLQAAAETERAADELLTTVHTIPASDIPEVTRRIRGALQSHGLTLAHLSTQIHEDAASGVDLAYSLIAEALHTLATALDTPEHNHT